MLSVRFRKPSSGPRAGERGGAPLCGGSLAGGSIIAEKQSVQLLEKPAMLRFLSEDGQRGLALFESGLEAGNGVVALGNLRLPFLLIARGRWPFHDGLGRAALWLRVGLFFWLVVVVGHKREKFSPIARGFAIGECDRTL